MSEDIELTQADVNEMFVEAKSVWDGMVKESGRSEEMFIALGGSNISTFLADYQQAKDFVESEGLVMPTLVEGLTISVSVGGEESE